MTLDELKDELRRGARVALMVRHGERPKMDPDDPSFGDALALTYEGCRTARKLGRLLAEFADDVQFAASPLRRTQMTAELIAEGMGVGGAEIPTDALLGNGSFYYADAAEVLEVFKPSNFFPASFEYFARGEQRGFRNLYVATDEFETWIATHMKSRLFVIATHDLFVAAFLAARKAGVFTRENWVRFLDGGAVVVRPDGSRRYALVRTGLSTGIVGARRPKVSAVVFDFGGVMTVTTMPERVRACVRANGLDWGVLERGFAKYRRMMDGGFIGLDEMYDQIWADANVTVAPEVRAEILKEDLASFLEGYRNERTLAWMKSLKAAGYRLGILTNMPPALAPKFKKTYADFIALADALVISGEERMFKPQRRIYDLLRARIGLPAEELCFVDDVESNCEGALAAGWHCVQFASNEQVERDFAALVG